MTPTPDKFTISEEESAKFARFSGDFNPLHVDRLVARRLQFGSTVIHGVHHMLRAWDVALSKPGLESGKRVASLHASFPNPVSTGRQISCETQLSADSSRVEISATAGGKRILSLTLGLAPGGEMPRHVQTLESAVPVELPVDQEFPPRMDQGECLLHCDKALARELFPNLARYCPDSLLAQLIACTRIVGMKCPGLHSVFSGISLTFRDAKDSDGRANLGYRVSASDDRMKLVKIDVRGPEIDGTLTAFFRPAPVEQPGYGVIRNEVPDDRFRTQRALVIGGSRGIGETTAKILAAGGADVTITYNNGEEDALRVQREISDGNGRCKTLRYDVLAALADGHVALTAGSGWTHVYYFASPKIEPDSGRGWNRDLFGKYCLFYIEAFSGLVASIARSAKDRDTVVEFFYPSSVFVDQPAKGFAEYAVAKASGEALCDQLQSIHANTRFHAPRLPRMATDQTTSIIPIKSESTLSVMLEELNRLAITDATPSKQARL